MLGKFFASSAPWQTQQIIMSVNDDQVEGEVHVQYKLELHTWLKREVNKADMTVFLSTRCYQKHIGNFLI